MFAQKSMLGTLAFAFAITATGAALADSSARGGYRDSVIVDRCAPTKSSGTSYRDAAARTEPDAAPIAAAYAGAGYRDQHARGPGEVQRRQTARAGALVCHN
ncbi:MAG TPA: hypothetical protein VGK73_09360 [Polyangiaceae bacterium]